MNAIELRNVSKRYANGTLANDGVSLCVAQGEIHAIVGENGAGKSTVMKMLYGLEQPTAGEILIGGNAVRFKHPREAIAAGIGLVPQHLELVPSFTVAENVVLGGEPMRGLLIDRRRAAADVAEVSRRFGLEVDPQALVSDLSVGQQQRVEILKTLYRGAKIVLLDEPSAVLTPQETQALFLALRKLVTAGFTVVLITHKLAEVQEVSDRFTVMRAGRVTGHAESRGARAGDITEMIVGRPVAPLRVSRRLTHAGAPLVAVRGLTLHGGDGQTHVEDVSFDIAAGEILGIAGVEGNGQAALADLLGGLRQPSRGTAVLDGRVFTGLGVRAVRTSRVALIPEDRLHNGVAADMSITENVMAVDYHKPPLSRLGWLDTSTARGAAQRVLTDYGVVARSPDQPISGLSGGNMQKVVLAREVASQPRFLVASQPTRGVDIGAAQFLRQRLVDLRDQGAAVLLISADLDEILALSDRIAVMFRGRIVAHFAAGTATARELGLHMTGLALGTEETA
jgi:general nucleoside transport system ATP-binding protein